MEEYEQLLHEIKKLSNKYKRDKQFNAFTTFGVNEKENMHSRFIAMLLNPNGDHNFGNRFLELFLKQLEINNFNSSGLKVECEKDAKGRRIDIAIWNPTHFLLIENKLWASDQDNQLRDYYNFALKNAKSEDNVFIIYLTPYGAMPSEISFSTGITPEGHRELPKDKVICISYEKHILQWLEACIDSINASDNIRLKISLEMYVELIRNVINRDKYMTEIINSLINSPSNMKLAIDIVKAFQGKNFLSSIDSREFIQKHISDTIYRHLEPKLDYDREPAGDTFLSFTLEIVNENPNIKNTKIGDICFDGVHIYGQKTNGEEIKENQIVCNDINDINLYNLLTNNIVEIDKWLESIVSELIK